MKKICSYCKGEVRCHLCGSENVREIIYGLLRFPDEKAKEEFNTKYFEGGCLSGGPSYHCDSCGKEFGDSSGFKWLPSMVNMEESDYALKAKIEELKNTKSFLEETIEEYEKHLKNLEEKMKGE